MSKLTNLEPIHPKCLLYYVLTLVKTLKSFLNHPRMRHQTIRGRSYTSAEKAMAPHSSTLAWKIPRMEEPGRLQSMGLLRVGHD